MPAAHHLVQLPFPSTRDPHPELRDYYRDYGRALSRVCPDFFVPERDLWELPLWVAHLAGMLESLGVEPRLVDLSRTHPDPTACGEALEAVVAAGDTVYFSPLAQNFALALQCSRSLRGRGVRTVVGGNMASLTGPENASVVFRGQLSLAGLRELLQKPEGLLEGRLAAGEGVTSVPRYRLLAGHGRRVPLLRINASHGCLFRCSFCGDAWSRRLLLVERAALEAEVAELEATFPDVHLVYVGDKTFGQSPQAVENLIAVFRCRPRYRFIVQTHFLLVDDGLIEAMHRLGVVVVELGLESADPSLLHAVRKSTHGPGHALSVVRRLQAEGFHVVLNVLGGLPQEKAESHALTVRFLEETASYVWLFNLYNFVPYPLTPAFPLLRERIFDWRFEHWREDGPPVFRPYHLCPEESWDLFLEKVATAHNIITRHESASPPAEAVGWSG